MSERVRDDSGQYTRKLTEEAVHEVLVHGTTAEEPMLTAGEVVEALATHRDVSVTAETVRVRLEALEAAGLVARKRFGARAVGWTALADPDPGVDVGDAVDAVRDAAVGDDGWLVDIPEAEESKGKEPETEESKATELEVESPDRKDPKEGGRKGEGDQP